MIVLAPCHAFSKIAKGTNFLCWTMPEVYLPLNVLFGPILGNYSNIGGIIYYINFAHYSCVLGNSIVKCLVNKLGRRGISRGSRPSRDWLLDKCGTMSSKPRSGWTVDVSGKEGRAAEPRARIKGKMYREYEQGKT